MKLYLLKSVLFVSFSLVFTQLTTAQDSLHYGMSIELEGIQHPFCVIWGENSAEKQFELEYSHYFDSIAHYIQSNPQAKFQIRCHTDLRGTDSLNLILSQKRADEWIKHMTDRGVDSSIITGIGVGEMFARKVWVKDSIYYIKNPHHIDAEMIFLNHDYINTFKHDRVFFEALNRMNRYTELTVTELDERAQSRVNYNIFLKKFHGDKQVVMIGAGTIQINDTMNIINEGDLHLHFFALGTENEFTLRSLERDEEYYYDKFYGHDEQLMDLSKAKGVYELDFTGDGGSGKLILVISK